MTQFQIPTYEEAKQIAKLSQGTFYEKTEEIDGRRFAIFNYRLAEGSDFKTPKHHELRGITYDLETGEPHLSVHKFFNQGENDKVLDKPSGELEVREKLDGSLIQPVVVKDTVLYKTKGTFFSHQAKLATEFAKEKGISQKILSLYNEEGVIPLFELVSPLNQIVVVYPDTELIMIQARRRNTGEYLSYDELLEIGKKYGIPVVNVYNYTFDELLHLQEKAEGMEGWIVWNKEQNPNAFRKIKTKWYFTLHHLIQPDNLYEHDIIEHILNETIDDILQQLAPDNPKRKQIEKIMHTVVRFFNRSIAEIKQIFETDKDLFDKSRKEFVMKYKSYHLFPVLMKVMEAESFNEQVARKALRIYIEKQTNKLEKARAFLKKIEGRI